MTNVLGERIGFAECATIQALLPSLLDRRSGAPKGVIDHVERCLSCQAELARHRKLLRLLASLRGDAPGASEMLFEVGEAARRRVVRSALSNHRIAYLAGVAVALGAGGVIAVAARRKGST